MTVGRRLITWLALLACVLALVSPIATESLNSDTDLENGMVELGEERSLQGAPTSSPTLSSPSRSPSKSPVSSAPTMSPSTSKPTAVPSKSPVTSQPTQSPSTSSPSKSPTTSPTTSAPSFSPSKSPTTSLPTATPSHRPTTSEPTFSPTTSAPSKSPSVSPTTSAPTLSPTTSAPSKSPTVSPTTSTPTLSPTTSKPSASPSNAPTTSTPTKSPTTSVPTESPSTAPTTSKPSSTPTTSKPSFNPSKSPSTSMPSKSPTTSTPSKSPTTSKPSNAPTRDLRPNVLLIMADDLKPLLRAYGNPYIPVNGTRNMDRLVNEGVSFMNAHAQMSICGPSRASLLTSMRMDTLRIYTISSPNILNTRIRANKQRGEILTVPKMFKLAGYQTYGVGKIFHENEFTLMQRADTWTVPMFSWVTKLARRPVFSTPYKGSWITSPEVQDEFFSDGQAARLAAQLITDVLAPNATTRGLPWFLALGLWKPHLPWTAPRKYFDACGSSNDFNGPYDTVLPKNMKANDYTFVRGSGCGEPRSYGGPASLNAGKTSLGALKQANRAYHATTMYMDAQMGIVLDALDSTGSRDNTYVVLLGDHGYHLGDKGLYCKHTNFEQGTKVPFIIAPALNDRHLYPIGTKSAAPVELLDLMPTLAELAKIRNFVDMSRFAPLQGLSLVPIMKDPVNGYVKQAAVSQYFRGRGSKMVWGYSVRTTRYRFTIWGNKKIEELYDYLQDAEETVSLHKNTVIRGKLVNFGYMQKRFGQGNNKMPFDFADRHLMLNHAPRGFP